MVQGGNWSVEKGSRTINPRGRLDCASFFLLLCGRRELLCGRELQQWLDPRRGDEVVESLWPGRSRLWSHCD